MRAWIIRILVLIIIGVIAATVWLLVKLNTTSPLVEFVPAESELVVYFNFKQIFLESAQKKDSVDYTWIKDKLKSFSPELSRISDAGIDPFGDAAAFVWNQDLFFCALLKDKQQLESVLLGTANKAEKLDNDWSYKLSSDGQIMWMWSDKLLYLSLKKTPASIQNLKSLTKIKHAFSKHANYLACKDDKAPIWFYARNVLFNESEYIKGHINLKQGIQIEAASLNENISEPIKSIAFLDTFKTVIYADSGYSKINQVLESGFLVFNQIDDAMTLPRFNQISKLMIFEGKKVIKYDFVNYEYDDNFEKVAVKSFKTDTVNSSRLIYRTRAGTAGSYCPYSSCDTACLNEIPANLICFAQFDETFISKIYNSPLGFLFKMQGVRQGNGHRYSVNIRIK